MTEREPEGGTTSAEDIQAAREMNTDAEVNRQIHDLTEYLAELRRIAAMEAELKKERTRFTELALPILEKIGTYRVSDPLTGAPLLAGVRQSNTLKVDAGELYDALIEQCGGDIDQAEMIWKDTLKPPEVDTKEEGRFHAACMKHGDTPALIAPETAVKVARYKPSAAYVGFAKPGG